MLFAHKLDITWHSVNVAVTELHQRMVEHGYKPKRILAVARGGMVPAVMLSHLFGGPEVHSIRVESYSDDHVQDVIRFQDMHIRSAHELFNRPDTLIVDDLWDSGNTHEWLRKEYPNAVTCTAFFKDRNDNSHRVVSFPGKSIPPGYWAEFPWELEASKG